MSTESQSINAISERSADVVLEKFMVRIGDGALPPRQKWLRRPAAAAYIGIDAITLSKWACAGIGPKVHHVGSRCIYSVDDLDEFVMSDGANLTGAK